MRELLEATFKHYAHSSGKSALKYLYSFLYFNVLENLHDAGGISTQILGMLGDTDNKRIRVRREKKKKKIVRLIRT